MDESFLSNARLIESSRNFVCIRLATYEDAEETEFLTNIHKGRTGELANTVFALLNPEADQLLSRAGRSPQFFYRSAEQLATAMDTISYAYPGNDSEANTLPAMKNFRLALNVASCDGLQLVVAVSDDAEQGQQLADALTTLAFKPELAGKCHFATATADELGNIENFESGPGVFVIQPGTYGVDGKVVHQHAADGSIDEFQTALLALAGETVRPRKSHREHVRGAYQSGNTWETEVPVTDPDSLRAMQSLQSGQQRGGEGRGGEGRSGQGPRGSAGGEGGRPPRGG